MYTFGICNQNPQKMIRKFLLGLFAVGIVFSAVIAVNLFLKYKKIEKNRAMLDESGVETEARVVSKNYSKTERLFFTMHKSQRFDSYRLKLRYDGNSSKGILSFNKALRGEKQDFDLSTKNQTIEIGVSKKLFDQVKKGDKMPVKYLPSDPKIVELLKEDGSYSYNYRRLVALGVLLLTGLISYLLYQYYTTGTTI